MLKKIIYIAISGLGALLLYVAFQPNEFVIARETYIEATPEVIFPFINNSKLANEWMPWQETDPGAVMVYSGPEEGVGSTTKWDSKGQMGTGQALVVESIPNKIVKTQLNYTHPMQMEQLAEISLIPVSEATAATETTSATLAVTQVRWQVTGKNNFVGRLFCLFLNMDKVVGSQFELGLAKLKQRAEAKK